MQSTSVASVSHPAVARGVALVHGQIRAFEALVGHASAVTPRISRWSVGMHIHHCSLAMVGVARAVMRQSGPRPRWTPNLLRTMVLLTGRIPRGRSQTPAEARPIPGYHERQLVSVLRDADDIVRELVDAPADAWFRHFALGIIRMRSVPRFLEVHNRHHLRIIRDILAG
jgi:hypothetical protein